MLITNISRPKKNKKQRTSVSVFFWYCNLVDVGSFNAFRPMDKTYVI
jgi:hypothetical protein